MKQTTIKGKSQSDGGFKIGTATHVQGGSGSYDDWNTITNILRIRKREHKARDNERGFVYGFPLKFGE